VSLIGDMESRVLVYVMVISEGANRRFVFGEKDQHPSKASASVADDSGAARIA
jgi:hypothetical protein